jgi:hypothetical protein
MPKTARDFLELISEYVEKSFWNAGNFDYHDELPNHEKAESDNFWTKDEDLKLAAYESVMTKEMADRL